MSEREELDTIKRWWEENGKAIIVGAILGITALIGWQTWTNYQRSMAEAASAEFEQLLREVDAGNTAAVEQRGTFIIEQYGRTAYADMAALELAQIEQDQGDTEAARAHLEQVMIDPNPPELEYVARLRLARILLDDGDYDAALRQLNVDVPEAFVAAFEELKGDIHVARNEPGLARTAYTKALAQLEPGMAPRTLQMKLDDLGSEAP